MKVFSTETRAFGIELGMAAAVGAVAAFVVPAHALEKIEDNLVIFLSIIAGAAIPGIALTAAAQRPPLESAVEAERLGARLEEQVRFWFGYLLVAGLSVISVLVAGAMDWQLATPRPSFVPSVVPDGGAWLVLLVVTLSTLSAIRMRRILDAVISLVRLGTLAHAAQALERRRQTQQDVAEQLRHIPPSRGRPAPVERREHH